MLSFLSRRITSRDRALLMPRFSSCRCTYIQGIAREREMFEKAFDLRNICLPCFALNLFTNLINSFTHFICKA